MNVKWPKQTNGPHYNVNGEQRAVQRSEFNQSGSLTLWDRSVAICSLKNSRVGGTLAAGLQGQ